MTRTTTAWRTAVGVNASQTVEDFEPRAMPAMTLHHEYTTQEYVQYQVSVRVPRTLVTFDESLTLRLSQTSTRVTCSLEVVHES